METVMRIWQSGDQPLTEVALLLTALIRELRTQLMHCVHQASQCGHIPQTIKMRAIQMRAPTLYNMKLLGISKGE
jgi:hypothetical protein